jgi:hypothetical protein
MKFRTDPVTILFTRNEKKFSDKIKFLNYFIIYKKIILIIVVHKIIYLNKKIYNLTEFFYSLDHQNIQKIFFLILIIFIYLSESFIAFE